MTELEELLIRWKAFNPVQREEVLLCLMNAEADLMQPSSRARANGLRRIGEDLATRQRALAVARSILQKVGHSFSRLPDIKEDT